MLSEFSANIICVALAYSEKYTRHNFHTFVQLVSESSHPEVCFITKVFLLKFYRTSREFGELTCFTSQNSQNSRKKLDISKHHIFLHSLHVTCPSSLLSDKSHGHLLIWNMCKFRTDKNPFSFSIKLQSGALLLY